MCEGEEHQQRMLAGGAGGRQSEAEGRGSGLSLSSGRSDFREPRGTTE